MNDLLVSVSCLTYNHEKYIKEALDSFIMQKVDFSYEILVHDDASTDKTADIIRAYEIEYPHLIKAIYQTENQYAKGIKVSKYNQNRAQGKYIAVCEGDDYWTDPFKLQKQVDYMKAHPDCSLCVHAAYLVNADSTKLKETVRPHVGNKEFSVEELITYGGRLFVTNSFLYERKNVVDRPRFYDLSPVGDYPLMILLALKGTVYYIDEFMSAYRIGLKNSWTNRTYSNSTNAINHFDKTIEMLDELNDFTAFAYKDVIDKRKKQVIFNRYVVQNRFDIIKKPEFSEFFNQLSSYEKIILHIRQYFPNAYGILKHLKRKWN